MRDIAGTVFGVEGNDAGRRAALDLIHALKGQSLELEGDQMAAYHAAAAIASNFVVGLLDAASELLASVGISHEQAVAALVPLAQGALDNVADRGVVSGLTGPIRRGDVDTVERHLRALSIASQDLVELYRRLGVRIVAVARQAEGADIAKLDQVESLLTNKPLSTSVANS
jgi:predicted short-subunit dehydrogenase-like oxidoreductase (DUF2520 family)